MTLQEPLRTVISFTGLVDQRYGEQLDDDVKKYLGFVSRAASRMNDLIKGLLDYSRIGYNKELITVDCKVLIQNILDDLTVRISETQTKMDISPLPSIRGYETELRVLFQNLISNAIKFRKPGMDPEIKISALRKKDQWEFCVADNGIGISSEYQEKIFVIFQRLHPVDVYEGTGIGLSHCQKIVDLHGGRIWVESQVGRGSAFYFTIPD